MFNDVKTILYASDLGNRTRPVFRMALDLAEKHDARVVYLHVIEPIGANVKHWVAEDAWDEMHEETLNSARTSSNQRIDDFFSEEVSENANLRRPDVKVISGRVYKTILEVADEEDADLIVMGSHANSAAGELLIGSTADKVVRLSRRPVVLVPIRD